ncbi:MAG: HEAT repeat domain-containing protein [Planctomycetota bacterium]
MDDIVGKLAQKPRQDLVVCLIDRLGSIGDARAIEPLIPLLQSTADSVQRAAIDALGALRAVPAVPALVALLKNEDLLVAWLAARALGQIADRSAIEPLWTFLAERRPCRLVARSLKAMGGTIGDRLRDAFVASGSIALAECLQEFGKLTDPDVLYRLLEMAAVELEEGSKPWDSSETHRRHYGQIVDILGEIPDAEIAGPLEICLQRNLEMLSRTGLKNKYQGRGRTDIVAEVHRRKNKIRRKNS